MLLLAIAAVQLLKFSIATVPAQPLVEERTIDHLAWPLPHLTTRQTVGDFVISTEDAASYPSPSEDLQYISLINCNDDNASGDLSQYPIVRHIPTGNTFWPLSYVDYRHSLAIVGFNSTGAVVTQFEVQGTRYICSIDFADPESFLFIGQAGTSVQVSFQQLLGNSPQPGPDSSDVAHVLLALKECVKCGNGNCKFNNTQIPTAEERRIPVGIPKLNCGGSEEEIEAEVDISQEIQETWSVGASVAVTAGPLSISVDPSYSIETKQIFMEKVKYKVRPGEKARCVAIVNYTITNGDLWKAGSQVGLVTSNVPATINGHDFEYVACDRKFITEQIPIQEPDSCNSATFRMLLGFAVWMPLCSFVTLFLFL